MRTKINLTMSLKQGRLGISELHLSNCPSKKEKLRPRFKTNQAREVARKKVITQGIQISVTLIGRQGCRR